MADEASVYHELQTAVAGALGTIRLAQQHDEYFGMVEPRQEVRMSAERVRRRQRNRTKKAKRTMARAIADLEKLLLLIRDVAEDNYRIDRSVNRELAQSFAGLGVAEPR